MTLDDIKAALLKGLVLQDTTTAAWHEPGRDPETDDLASYADPAGIDGCILAQHVCNFTLWHIEDTARRTDVDDAVIADCKRRIDGWNQRRNDGMEKVDAAVIGRMQPLLPAYTGEPRYNTESLGMAVDRMSILSLKIWHMDEQLLRTDVDAAHIQSCADKAGVLREQRRDLERSILQLLDDFTSGARQPRFYFQFKMYNDPSLNPELYGTKQ